MTERSKQILKSAAQKRILELRAKVREHERDGCYTQNVSQMLINLIYETETAIRELDDYKNK